MKRFIHRKYLDAIGELLVPVIFCFSGLIINRSELLSYISLLVGFLISAYLVFTRIMLNDIAMRNNTEKQFEVFEKLYSYNRKRNMAYFVLMVVSISYIPVWFGISYYKKTLTYYIQNEPHWFFFCMLTFISLILYCAFNLFDIKKNPYKYLHRMLKSQVQKEIDKILEDEDKDSEAEVEEKKDKLFIIKGKLDKMDLNLNSHIEDLMKIVKDLDHIIN